MTDDELKAIEEMSKAISNPCCTMLSVVAGDTVDDLIVGIDKGVDEKRLAKFISHAPIVIPALCAEVRRLQAQLEDYQNEVDCANHAFNQMQKDARKAIAQAKEDNAL